MNNYPFPTRIRTERQKEKYLSQIKLTDQLNDLVDTLKQAPRTDRVLFKIYGANMPDNFSFSYNKVRFWSKNHPKLNNLKVKLKRGNEHVDFFEKDENYFLADIQTAYHTLESIKDLVWGDVILEVNYLSAILKRDFIIDPTQNFILTDLALRFKGFYVSSHDFSSPISEWDLEGLKDNGYSVLKSTNSEGKDWFLSYEPYFVHAHKDNNISEYWHYLEALLPKKTKSDGRLEKQVKDLVSTIVLTNEKLVRDRRVLSTIRDSFGGFNGYGLLKVTNERRVAIFKSIQSGKIPKEIRTFEYPFTKELVSEYDKDLDSSDYAKAKEYYSKILLEAYEFRNFYLHSGVSNKKASIKLALSLPRLVVRFRWAVFKELECNPTLPFPMIIDKLFGEGMALLKKT